MNRVQARTLSDYQILTAASTDLPGVYVVGDNDEDVKAAPEQEFVIDLDPDALLEEGISENEHHRINW